MWIKINMATLQSYLAMPIKIERIPSLWPRNCVPSTQMCNSISHLLLLVWVKINMITLQSYLAMPVKIERILSLWPRNCVPRNLSNRIAYSCSTKPMYKSVDSNIILSCPELDTQMSLSCKMDMLCYIFFNRLIYRAERMNELPLHQQYRWMLQT